MDNENKVPTTAQEVAKDVQEPAKDIKDIVQQGANVLLALYALFATLNIQFEWLNPDSINALALFAVAFLTFGVSLWNGWRNSYLTAKGIERAAKVIDKNAGKE